MGSANKDGLSAQRLRELVSAGTPGRFQDGPGLFLQVVSSTNISWTFRYQLNGKSNTIGLGSYLKGVTTQIARKKAAIIRGQLAEGIDPLQQKATDRANRSAARAEAAAKKAHTVTFEKAAQAYYDLHNKKWRNDKHRAQFLSTLKTYAYPIIGDMAVADIKRGDVARVLEQPMDGTDFWHAKPETAGRVRNRIEMVLDFSAARDWRDDRNPARWKGNLSMLLPKKSDIKPETGFLWLPYEELPGFITDLRKREGVAAKALEFIILTATRTNEVIGALRTEINWDEAVWTIPKERMKTRKSMEEDHRIPLCPEAMALLRSLPPEEEGNPYLFIGLRKAGLSNMAMDALLRRMGVKDKATVHGFRKTFRSFIADKTSFPGDLAEAALAHIPDNKVLRTYQKGDMLARRREMMRVWTDWCEGRTPTGGNVVSLRGEIQAA